MYDYIFCLPGNPKSGIQALNTFVALNSLISKGKKIGIKHATSNNIYAVRNGCLSMKESQKYQKPFEGTPYEDYKYIVWVDSDNIISAEQIEALVAHDKDIMAAWYLQGQGKSRVSCGMLSDNQAIPLNEIDMRFKIEKYNKTEPFKVDYSGMGLMVVKKGVFESMTYPWFKSWIIDWEEDGIQMTRIVMDDECFCLSAMELGFDIYVDPMVRIEHEKAVRI